MDEQTPESTEVSGGQGGGLLEDPHRQRGDAVLIQASNKWKGIVDPERVKPLIERGYELAANSDSERGYAAVMKVIQGFAKLEQDEHKAATADAGPVTNIQINDCSFTTNDPRAELLGILAAASERARAAESSGTIDAPTDTEPGVQAETAD
jgi:hypothetical protein